jgi:hypothetical protein
MVLNVQDRNDKKTAPSTETSTTVVSVPPPTPGAMPSLGRNGESPPPSTAEQTFR